MPDPFGTATYDSDDGNLYNIRLNSGHFTAAAIATGGALPAYPKHWRTRLLHGKTDTGKHASIPCGASDSRFINGGAAFVIDGVSYQITGVSGEKRPGLAKPF